MFTVVTGRSGRLWPRVLLEMGRAHASLAERLFLITPDQYTLQAELDLIDGLNLPGLLQMEVLSPSRMLTRVFQLAGSPGRVRIDSRGKAMVIADILRGVQGKLTYYAGSVERRGFADRLLSSIGDFKRSGMGPGEVEALALDQAEGSALRAKLTDIALLYGAYEERLAGAFLDGEDAQEALTERIPQSGLFDGAHLWIYGFDLVSPQFLRQMAAMARQAAGVRLFLTMENEQARDGHVFAAAREALSMLGRLFDEEHILWEREHVEAELPAAPEIRHLEKELFAVPPAPFAGEAKAIALLAAESPHEEAMQVAARLLAFARQGIPFDAMAVVVGDAESYASAIEMAFSRSGVPFHLTRKRPLLAHPLVRGLLSALRTVTTQWRRQEDALDWLKGGFSGLTAEEAEKLENYAIENGLRGVKWRRRIGDADLEALRARFTAPLQALQERLRKARTNTQSLSAVYTLLEDVDAYGTLTAWQDAFMARGLYTEAAECTQAWRLLLEALDQLHELLGGSRMRMDGMARVMESGLAAAELDVVPPSPGIVQVGTLGHAKVGGDMRVLFLMGMQDGVLRRDTPQLIADAEAAGLSDQGREGAFGLRGDALGQLTQMGLLDVLAAARERLIISHALSGAGGDAQRPAAWLGLLRRVFPALAEAGGVRAPGPLWHAPGAALDALGGTLRSAAVRGSLSPLEAETASWLYHSDRTRVQTEDVLRTLTAPMPVKSIPRDVAGALYAHTRTSVSRLESFAGCPFRHYVAFGLRPVPRRAFEVARNETGTFYHRAMEGYTRAALAHPAWPDISRGESDRLMDEVLSPLEAEWEDAPLGDNALMRATGRAFSRIARRSAWNYAAQMKRGGFRTGHIEARFGPGEALPPIALHLPGGQTRFLEGRIDRIDFYEEDGERWLRVVDYKSGGATLDLLRVYGGLQLQLLLYLSAALAASPGIRPAGAFYSRFDDPYVETDSRDVAEIERLLQDALRLRGIALSDVRVIRAMDDQRLLTRDGVKKSAAVMSGEGLDALMHHARTLAQGMAGAIAEGEIAARPARMKQWRACQWCEYHSICGFDAQMPGYDFRDIESIGKEELLRRLGVEEKQDE